MMKIVILLSSLMVGFFYTRRELGALVQCITEKDYIELYELNKEVARREFAI